MSQKLTPGEYAANPADQHQSLPFHVGPDDVLMWTDGQQYVWDDEEGKYVSVLAPPKTLEFYADPLIYLAMGAVIEVGGWSPI